MFPSDRAIVGWKSDELISTFHRQGTTQSAINRLGRLVNGNLTMREYGIFPIRSQVTVTVL